jgi:hypothetical protein
LEISCRGCTTCRGLGEPLDSVELLHSNWEMKAPLCTRLSERAVQTEEK